MTRIKFQKGSQRKFLDKVINEIGSPSLRELSKRILINYQSLKSYYSENRLMPEELIKDLCFLSKIDIKDLKITKLDDNWGKILGGKISKRKR